MLHEIWGIPDNLDPGEGVMPVIMRESDTLDKNAVEVYNLVRVACVVTGLAAVVAMFVVVLGLPG